MEVAPRRSISSLSRQERLLIGFIVASLGILSFWLASNRTLDPGYPRPGEEFNNDFFRQQAIALLNGRLHVPFNAEVFNECFFREGRCYGYFGLTPSLIRIGAFAVALSTNPNPSPSIIAGGVMVALWASIYLAMGLAAGGPAGRQLTSVSRRWLIILVGAVLGLGSLLVFLSQAKVYYEPIVLMVAGLGVSFCFVHRWLVSRQSSHLIIAIIAAVAATNSRPAALIPTFILGLGVAVIAIRSSDRSSPLPILLGAGLTLLPTMSALSVMWAKFRSFSPQAEAVSYFETTAMQQILAANDGSLRGLRFGPSNLINYLRPDAMNFGGPWPSVRHSVPFEKELVLLSPMSRAGIYAEFVGSLPTMMPVALVLTFGFTFLLTVGFTVTAADALVRLDRTERQTFVLLMSSSITAPIAMLFSYTITTRFLGDFFPLLAVGTVFALVWLVALLQDRPRVFVIIAAGFLLSAAATFWINQSLQMQTSTIFG